MPPVEANDPHRTDVVILGAGMAGLSAARVLAESGLRVLVLEARNRIGGRIFTERQGDDILELGAEFIHGRPPELWKLIEEAGLATYERTGAFLRLEGEHVVSMEDEDEEDDPTAAPLEALESFQGPDRSFAEYIQGCGLAAEDTEAAISYVEGFNAADATQASARALGVQQQAEDAIDGDRVWRIRDGYDRLPAWLAGRIRGAGGEIRLETRVSGVRWTPGVVEIETSSGIFKASRAVIALPLAVLQSGAISFSPAPAVHLDALRRLRMGTVCRFTLRFKTAFWRSKPDFEMLSFLLTPETRPAVWWTAHPIESATLTGWVGGPRALPLLALSRDELTALACDALAEALSMPLVQIHANLISLHMHDWQQDPDALGAYTWLPVGALDEPGAPDELTRPVEDTLFFAGEHTDITGHWGTVHAALRSGLRAASQVLQSSGI